jgi:hypothetical protein
MRNCEEKKEETKTTKIIGDIDKQEEKISLSEFDIKLKDKN